jgi:hypothetical protein
MVQPLLEYPATLESFEVKASTVHGIAVDRAA